MPKTRSRPAYTLHRPTGQARVRIDGRDHYLGAYGSPESRDEYDRLITAWLAKQDPTLCRLTLDDLALLYLAHAESYYRKDGAPTGELSAIRVALRHLITVHGRTRIREFGPLALKEVRAAMIAAGHVRTSINAQVRRIRTMFRWAVSEQLAPVEVWQALGAVPGLREGRSAAREPDPVRPVDHATVEATLAQLPRVVADMVRLQLLTGARPGEICAMRPRDVSRSAPNVWTYRPASHKTEHHGRERRIFIGPQAQAVLAPYLLRDADAHCFQPGESESKRNAARREGRRSAMTPSQASRRPKGRALRDRYTKDTYRRAVERGCEAAFRMPAELRNVARTVARIPGATEAERSEAKMRLNREAAAWRNEHCWSPNQLRHSRATIIREKYGIEAAQVVLGHSDPRVTEIYAERDFARAASIMAEIG